MMGANYGAVDHLQGIGNQPTFVQRVHDLLPELGGQRLGMRGSKRLVSSPHLGKLEVLRLPFNNIKVGAARSLLAALEEGALPALRRLELADEIESPWGVPSDVAYQANEIPRALVAHIEAVLKARG